eukprot:8596603-Pyramimonas_sp.AAC.1
MAASGAFFNGLMTNQLTKNSAPLPVELMIEADVNNRVDGEGITRRISPDCLDAHYWTFIVPLYTKQTQEDDDEEEGSEEEWSEEEGSEEEGSELDLTSTSEDDESSTSAGDSTSSNLATSEQDDAEPSGTRSDFGRTFEPGL